MADTARIVFVAPPLRWDEAPRMDIKPPLNLVYLASYVKAAGVSAALVDVAAAVVAINAGRTDVHETPWRRDEIVEQVFDL